MILDAVSQITFKGRVPTRSFGGSIVVALPTSSHVFHLFCRVRWPTLLGFSTKTPLLSGTLGMSANPILTGLQ